MNRSRVLVYIFSTIVVLMSMALSIASTRLNLPLPSEQSSLDIMKLKLAENPEDIKLRTKIRELDLQHRQRDWEMWRFIRAGSWILAAAITALVISMHRANKSPIVTEPADPPPGGWQARRAKSMTLGVASVLGLTVILSGVTAIVVWRSNIPVEYAPEPELDIRWPRFRGLGGQGQTDMPVNLSKATIDFDSQKPENGWKSRIPLPGKSSPVIYGNHVFVTGATEREKRVMAYSAATGRMLWETAIPQQELSKKEQEEYVVYEDTGHAAPTGCTDGSRFYAIFTDVTVAAVDFNGKLVWSKFLGPPVSTYNFSSSVMMADGKLIIQYDQDFIDEEDGSQTPRSALLALDPATGKIIWKTSRNVCDSWCSPVLMKTSTGPQIITLADPCIIAYNPVDGKEIWRADVFGTGVEIAPSPVYTNDHIFVAMDAHGTVAVKTGGQGNVTKTHIAWRNDETSAPDTASPLIAGKYLVMVSGHIITCLDHQTGKVAGKLALDDNSFNASPSLVGGGKVLLLDTRGRIFIIEPGDECRILDKFDLRQSCDGSPAFGDGRIFLRGKRHLFCLNVSQEGNGS